MKLVMTEEEKKTAALDLSDEDLGKWARMLIVMMNNFHAKGAHENKLGLMCAAQFVLIQNVRESNADESVYEFEGVTTNGVPDGDWVVTVRRKKTLMQRLKSLWYSIKKFSFRREQMSIKVVSADPSQNKVKWTAEDGTDKSLLLHKPPTDTKH